MDAALEFMDKTLVERWDKLSTKVSMIKMSCGQLRYLRIAMLYVVDRLAAISQYYTLCSLMLIVCCVFSSCRR